MRPSFYLEASLTWSHRLALPTLLCCLLLLDQVTHASCDQSSRYIQCKVARVRKIVMIPCTAISFLSHFIVLLDDVFSLRDSYNRLTAFLRTLMSDVTNIDIEDSVVMNYSNYDYKWCSIFIFVGFSNSI